MPFALHRTGLPSYKLSTTIAKAAAPDDPFERLATRAEREIARAVYDLLSGLPDTAWARELRRRIRAGDWQAVNEQLVQAPYSPEQYRALAEAVTRALQQGTELALSLDPSAKPAEAPVTATLEQRLPPAVAESLRLWHTMVADGNLAVTNAHVLPDSSEDFSDSSMVLQVRGAANALLVARNRARRNQQHLASAQHVAKSGSFELDFRTCFRDKPEVAKNREQFVSYLGDRMKVAPTNLDAPRQTQVEGQAAQFCFAGCTIDLAQPRLECRFDLVLECIDSTSNSRFLSRWNVTHERQDRREFTFFAEHAGVFDAKGRFIGRDRKSIAVTCTECFETFLDGLDGIFVAHACA